MVGKRRFLEESMFHYNIRKKRAFGAAIIVIGMFLFLIVLDYVLILRKSDFFLVTFINTVFSHIGSQVAAKTLLGVFYTALFGGLFFVFMPVEALFISYLKSDAPDIMIMLVYIFGFIISYTINYYVGFRLSKLAKKLISAKQFYKLKGTVNKYGGLAIFGFNALPLPSQPLATILGVFRYNKTRFYVFFILGQVVKYTVIMLVF